MKGTCRHCTKNKVTRPRGLCDRCYYRPAVRALYPPRPGLGRHPERGDPDETAAELDAIIAQQMKNLPPWWHDCHGADPGEDQR